MVIAVTVRIDRLNRRLLDRRRDAWRAVGGVGLKAHSVAIIVPTSASITSMAKKIGTTSGS